MSVATEITRLRNAKAALKESIEAKGVTVEDTAKLDEYPALVDTIPQGGSGVEEKDVNFYDYDGTCLYSYTKDEFLALNEMPVLPDHSNEGLTSDKWNWTLENAKTIVSSYKYLNIGATYYISDDKNRLFVKIDNDDLSFSLYLTGNGTIDWGDGIQEQMPTSIGVIEHNYTNPGNYIVKLWATNKIFSSSGNTGNITGTFNSTNGSNKNSLKIKKAFISYNTSFGFSSLSYLFLGCGELESIVFDSRNNSNPGDYMFAETRSLKCIILNSNNINAYAFYNSSISIICFCGNEDTRFNTYCFFGCYNLKNIYYNYTYNSYYTYSLSNNIFTNSSIRNIYIGKYYTTISGKESFKNTRLLRKIYILSENLSNIGNMVFYDTFDVLEGIYIYSPNPPTIQAATFKTNFTFKIYVPTESVEAYKAATNWSAYADKIFPIPTE